MEDIDLARSLLEEEKWNLVVVKGGQVLLSSRERGVAPFFQAVQSMGKVYIMLQWLTASWARL